MAEYTRNPQNARDYVQASEVAAKHPLLATRGFCTHDYDDEAEPNRGDGDDNRCEEFNRRLREG